MKGMKTIFLSSVAAIILLCSFVTESRAPYPPQQVLKTIIIDPGHGLPDGGNEGSRSHESKVSLAIALKLGKLLQQKLPDCKILYTRTDENLPNGLSRSGEANRWRAQFANNNHGDLFISIHCNSTSPVYHKEFTGYKKDVYYTGKGKKRKKHYRKVAQYRTWTTPSPVKGTETFIWAVDKNDQKKTFIGSMDAGEGEQSDSTAAEDFFNSTEAKILASLRAKNFFYKSQVLAEMVEEEFVSDKRISRGAKQRNERGIWVLAATAMPSILVESGFLSNPDEEDYLNSEEGQNEVSGAVTRAVLRYKTFLENGGTRK